MHPALLWDTATNEAIREAVGPAAPALEVLTHLGDGTVLLVAGVLLYWFGAERTRRNRAFVIAVGTAALALSAGLKGVVQLPRPVLVFAPADYPGYSFPSAHAVGSAAFYGALAVSVKRGRRWTRYLLAAVVVAVVALSRVVMGVHYLGDVVVGVLLGLSVVGVGVWIRDEGLFDPGPIFVLSAVVAGGAFLLGSRVFVPLTLGASVGGTVGWYYTRGRRGTDSGAAILVLGVGGLVGLLALRGLSALVWLVAPLGALAPLLPVVETVGYTVLTVLVVAVPTLATRIEDNPSVRRLQTALPFRGRIVERDDAPREGS